MEDYRLPSVESSFIPVKLPQIRRLVIDTRVHFLMKCCTNVRKVVIFRIGFDSMPFESIPNSLVHLALCRPWPHHVQGVGGFLLRQLVCNSNQRTDAVSLCPNLEEFGVIQVS